jgi:hypothetical protein
MTLRRKSVRTAFIFISLVLLAPSRLQLHAKENPIPEKKEEDKASVPTVESTASLLNLEMVRDEAGTDKFSLSFTQRGALVTATLRLHVSRLQDATLAAGSLTRKIPSILREQTYFRIMDPVGVPSYLAAAHPLAPTGIASELARSFFLPQSQSAPALKLLHSGKAEVVWTYAYDTPVEVKPYDASIVISWRDVYPAVEAAIGFDETILKDRILLLNQQLIDRGVIEIKTVTPLDAEQKALLLDDVTRIVLARIFEAQGSEGMQLRVPDRNPSGLTKLNLSWMGNLPSHDESVDSFLSGNYRLKRVQSSELDEEQFLVKSARQRIKSLTADIRIRVSCELLEKHLSYTGDVRSEEGTYPILKGCPETSSLTTPGLQ